MELTVCSSGMRAATRGFGTTEYWAYRVTYCAAPADRPGLFCWIYRHERPRMKQELRCHAALCVRPEQAAQLAAALRERLSLALQEFRREKLTRQKARLSLANAVYDCPSMPHRKLLLSRGTINFRPPIEMSKIAPKLQPIDEDELEEEEEEYEDDLLYLSSSESSSLASSPEDEDLFPRFRRQARISINSQGDTSCSSASSDEDICEEEASSMS